MPSPKLAPVVLSTQGRSALEALAWRRKTSQALALRARIVLACANSGSVTAVATDLEITRGTVRKWRGRFLEDRLAGLGDAPRPGAPRTITDEQVQLVIAKTVAERGPGQDTHWSTRSMAAATGMSQTAISRIWRAFGLKPDLVQTWRLSADLSSSPKSATSWAFTSTRRTRHWSWRSMGKARSRPWTWTKPPARSDTLAAYGRRINDSGH
jgi:transposase-like protein